MPSRSRSRDLSPVRRSPTPAGRSRSPRRSISPRSNSRSRTPSRTRSPTNTRGSGRRGRDVSRSRTRTPSRSRSRTPSDRRSRSRSYTRSPGRGSPVRQSAKVRHNAALTLRAKYERGAQMTLKPATHSVLTTGQYTDLERTCRLLSKSSRKTSRRHMFRKYLAAMDLLSTSTCP